MTDFRLPGRAVSWIVSHLRSVNINVTKTTEEMMHSSTCGLKALKIPELKLLAKHLEVLYASDDSSCSSGRFRKPPSKAKKGRMDEMHTKMFLRR
mmetsp:Transcript_7814/g.11647  ORF Transcript_7814/g.11647 Transcript_7814/m.11647 type:complete len:95 (+) Transcript_7814:264-548(+)